jgi:hypothetical protein
MQIVTFNPRVLSSSLWSAGCLRGKTISCLSGKERFISDRLKLRLPRATLASSPRPDTLEVDKDMASDKDAALKRLSVRVDALRRAMDAIMSGSTPDHAKWGAFRNYASVYNRFAEEYVNITGNTGVLKYDISKMKGATGTVWPVQKAIFDTVYAETLILSSALSEYDSGVSASISEIQDLLAANLRKVIFSKPDKEVDVQNAIETLLVGRGYQKSIHYDREAGKVKLSGKEFIPDFIFPIFNLALEVKLIKEKSQISQCIEEMSADIPAYMSSYDNILFCVYDLGAIRDVIEFQEGLQKLGGVRICVIKH